MYKAPASPLPTVPTTRKPICTIRSSGVGTHASVTSAAIPISSTLSTVPTPGR